MVKLANRNLKSRSERWTASASANELKYKEIKQFKQNLGLM